MSRPQLQDSEAVSELPEKAILAQVFNYLKNKNLKDTEEALRKELSGIGATSTSAFEGVQLSSVGQSPLLTTCSSDTAGDDTGAEVSTSQLDKVPLPSDSPNNDDSFSLSSDNHQDHHPQSSSESSSHCNGAEQEDEVEEECSVAEFYEEEQKDDMEVGEVMATAAASSPASSINTSPTNFGGLSNGFVDKRPLWAAKPLAAATGVSLSPTNMGGVSPPLPGIAAVAPPPVHSSIPLSRPLGVRNVIFQCSFHQQVLGGHQ